MPPKLRRRSLPLRRAAHHAGGSSTSAAMQVRTRSTPPADQPLRMSDLPNGPLALEETAAVTSMAMADRALSRRPDRTPVTVGDGLTDLQAPGPSGGGQ